MASVWSGESGTGRPKPDALAERHAGGPTLPRQLVAAGYRTFITGKWHNGEEALLRSFDRGTAVYLGGMADHTQVEVRDMEDGELIRRRVGQAFSSELFADAVIALT